MTAEDELDFESVSDFDPVVELGRNPKIKSKPKISAKSSILQSKLLESKKPTVTSEDKDNQSSSSSSSRSSTSSLSTEFVTPKYVDTAFGTKHVVLLMKIIRSIILSLSPDTKQVSIKMYDRCYQ